MTMKELQALYNNLSGQEFKSIEEPFAKQHIINSIIYYADKKRHEQMKL
jgi:hypothetical protein